MSENEDFDAGVDAALSAVRTEMIRLRAGWAACEAEHEAQTARLRELVEEIKTRYDAFPEGDPVKWAYGWCAQTLDAALGGPKEST